MEKIERQKFKEPVRQCFACRTKNFKKNLLRVVRTKEGKILIDCNGKINGRGTYLCFNEQCLQQLKKKRGLQRSLKKDVGEKIFFELEKRIIEKK